MNRRLPTTLAAAAVLGSVLSTSPVHAATDWAALAKSYAPFIWIHSTEQYQPISASSFISNSVLRWATSNSTEYAYSGRPDAARLGAASTNAYRYYYTSSGEAAWQLTRPHDPNPSRLSYLPENQGFFLNLDNSKRVGEPAQGLHPGASYYEWRHNTDGTHDATYWFHYAYSTELGVGHEGDWERITIHFSSGLAPLKVRYFQHTCSTTLAWTHSDVKKSSTHVIAWAADGSHASYPSEYLGGNSASLKSCSTGVQAAKSDYVDSGVLWNAAYGIADATAQPWYGFGGAWGVRGSTATTSGPLGPSRFKASPGAW